jgi:Phosphoribosyl transferase/TRSP domain C terminus to PRTase_2
MANRFSVALATGTLQIDLAPGRIPLRRLLGFANRINSQRQFLLVSKVLGKHYPVAPRLMAWSYRALAKQILSHAIAGQSVWVGMAETATGLGYGVFAAACQLGVQQALYLQTTRYHLAGVNHLAFQEVHSHATDLFLYYPDTSSRQQYFLQAQTLVLVDDEISTGRTFARLIQAYKALNPHLAQVFIVSLVNFAGVTDRQALQQAAGIPVVWVALRQGSLSFIADSQPLPPNPAINVVGNGADKSHLLAWPGRQGIDRAITLPKTAIVALQKYFNATTRPDSGQTLLVLGTGECNAPAFLLGRMLECQGFQVRVQSTTRSPIRLGNDITRVCQFTDNYGDNIPNFLYNLALSHYQEIIVCHETPLTPALLHCLQQWQAISAYSHVAANSHHASLHFSRP